MGISAKRLSLKGVVACVVLGIGVSYAADANLEKIKELEKRTAWVNHHVGSEETGDQYNGLINQVAELNDPRAVPALIAVDGLNGIDGLAAMRDNALDPVISAALGKNPKQAFRAVYTLKRMLVPYNLNQFKDPRLAEHKIRTTFESLKNTTDRNIAAIAKEGLAGQYD